MAWWWGLAPEPLPVSPPAQVGMCDTTVYARLILGCTSGLDKPSGEGLGVRPVTCPGVEGVPARGRGLKPQTAPGRPTPEEFILREVGAFHRGGRGRLSWASCAVGGGWPGAQWDSVRNQQPIWQD